jgi:hypothetical protein
MFNEEYFYYDDITERCSECESHEKTKEGVCYWFETLIDELYRKKEIDLEAISLAVEECSHLLGIKFPLESLNLQRGCKVSSIRKLDVLQDWMSFNHKFLLSNSYQTEQGAI